MTAYKLVSEKNGAWCVIVTGILREDRYFGFRDETHAQEWIAQELEKKRLAAKLGLLVT